MCVVLERHAALTAPTAHHYYLATNVGTSQRYTCLSSLTCSDIVAIPETHTHYRIRAARALCSVVAHLVTDP